MWFRKNNKTTAKQKLDRAGRAVIQAGSLRDEEIKAIAAAPYLFQQLRARIETEREQRGSVMNQLPVVNTSWQAPRWGLLATAVLLLMVISGLLWEGMNRAAPDQQARVLKPEVIKPTIPDIGGLQPENSKADEQIVERSFLPVAQKHKSMRPAKMVRLVSRPEEESAEFIHLTTQPGDEEAEQIVRVELPRSSLRAWGLQVSPELTNEKVQAEVVISSDGVTRSIRIVN